jgi:hypothetical protein
MAKNKKLIWSLLEWLLFIIFLGLFFVLMVDVWSKFTAELTTTGNNKYAHLTLATGLPDFFLVQYTKTGKIYLIATKYVYQIAITYAFSIFRSQFFNQFWL